MALASVAVLALGSVFGSACVSADRSVTGPSSSAAVTVPERCRSDFVALSKATEVFRERSGRYPASVAELKALELLSADVDSYDLRPRSDPASPPEIVPATAACPARPAGPALRESTTQEAACDTDRTLVEGALAAYELIHGEPATSMQALVTGGVLVSPSELHDIAAGGEIVPRPGSGCPD